jgi:UDPglucose--hexose-1-phosphate uridylyltransferase
MIVSRRRLADGREIVYFDAAGTPGTRQATDTRVLPVTTTHSQCRFDALLGEWVVIASHRQSRTFLPPADQCPLCPSTPERATEIPEHDYQVVVFENRFPSLATSIDADLPGKLKYLAGSESGMNVFIDDTTPEYAAEALRSVVAT